MDWLIPMAVIVIPGFLYHNWRRLQREDRRTVQVQPVTTRKRGWLL